ncbi:MAG TPA: pilus assembly protein [Candidatus Brocadiia bacterium]|nr:pilus assembly protein [Candidatus Brocadiia bacterium]
MMNCKYKGARAGETGQAIIEFAIAFPLQLLAVLTIMQLSLLYCAKQVLHVAAVRAVQAAVVADPSMGDDPEENARFVAAFICSPITGPTLPDGAEAIPEDADAEIPGWGFMPRFGISRYLKTNTIVERAEGRVTVTVTHDYELVIPFINSVFAWTGGSGFLWSSEEVEMAEGLDGKSGGEESGAIYPTPHLRMSATATMADIGPSHPGFVAEAPE